MNDFERQLKKQRFLDRVAAIDDEEEFLTFIKNMLTKRGFVVQTKEVNDNLITALNNMELYRAKCVEQDIVIKDGRLAITTELSRMENIQTYDFTKDERDKMIAEAAIHVAYELGRDILTNGHCKIEVIENPFPNFPDKITCVKVTMKVVK